MAETELIQLINQQLETEFNDSISTEDLLNNLSACINELIKQDFPKLISILYKVDVDEQKLKKILKEEAGKDASIIIAGIIIEREMQKLKTRTEFKEKNNFKAIKL